MLCADNIGKLIKDEIKFNVKVCNVKTDWLKDKEVISLDVGLRVFDIYPEGTANLTRIRGTKTIRYLIIRNKLGMYLCDMHDGHQAGAYRSRQTAIWDYFNDVNKLNEEWWLSHIKHYSRRFIKYKSSMNVAESYLACLEYWVSRGQGTNYFTDTVELAFNGAIESVHEAIRTLKEVEANVEREVVCSGISEKSE